MAEEMTKLDWAATSLEMAYDEMGKGDALSACVMLHAALADVIALLRSLPAPAAETPDSPAADAPTADGDTGRIVAWWCQSCRTRVAVDSQNHCVRCGYWHPEPIREIPKAEHPEKLPTADGAVSDEELSEGFSFAAASTPVSGGGTLELGKVARRALYNLGREQGRREAVAGRGAERIAELEERWGYKLGELRADAGRQKIAMEERCKKLEVERDAARLQLQAADATIAAWRPVVSAAIRWRLNDRDPQHVHGDCDCLDVMADEIDALPAEQRPED